MRQGSAIPPTLFLLIALVGAAVAWRIQASAGAAAAGAFQAAVVVAAALRAAPSTARACSSSSR
jgi:hypothetical protein